MNEDHTKPAIGRFGWIALSAGGTAVAAIAAYVFTVAMDSPLVRLQDLREEMHREIDGVTEDHVRMLAQNQILEKRVDRLMNELRETESTIAANTTARLRGGRFTSDDGERLEKMINALERRIERLEDKLYIPLYRPKILEEPTNGR